MSLGIYIHLPFCSVHCTYCAFAISTDSTLQEQYGDALVREISAVEGRPAAATVYLGGGTPSRTAIPILSRVLRAIRERFEVVGEAEVTLEANPEDVDGDALAAWRDLGVNRLSVGVQSFDDDELASIGRAHDREKAIAAVWMAVSSGLRISLDLMLGLPGQTAESFRSSLAQAIDLEAGHCSLYMLDLEERTPLEAQVARGRVSLPEDESVADLYVEAIDRLHAAGLQQYEISNFARAGQESRHNLRYWTRGEYRGFGMAAHSFIGSRRFANTRDIRRYVERSPDAMEMNEDLGPDEARREAIFLQLRQTKGICYEELVRLTGEEGARWSERGIENGYLRAAEGRVAFTSLGFLQSNELISQLF